MLYQQECYDIVGAAMKVYNTLGPGFLEAVYHEALEIEFDKRKILFDSEKNIDNLLRWCLSQTKISSGFLLQE